MRRCGRCMPSRRLEILGNRRKSQFLCSNAPPNQTMSFFQKRPKKRSTNFEESAEIVPNKRCGTFKNQMRHVVVGPAKLYVNMCEATGIANKRGMGGRGVGGCA